MNDGYNLDLQREKSSQEDNDCDLDARQNNEVNPPRASQAGCQDQIGKDHHEASASIELLQQKQSELQQQLDEVSTIAKELEMKQKKKIIDSLNHTTKQSVRPTLDEDDDELIEFQQIENELRKSDLNRQLTNIQEQLRLTLYSRLLANNSHFRTNQLKHDEIDGRDKKTIARRNSTQTDESTPSSSSCSDEPTATSSTNMDPLQSNHQSSDNISTISSINSLDYSAHLSNRLALGLKLDSSHQHTNSNTSEFYTAERESNDTNSDVSSIHSSCRSKSNLPNEVEACNEERYSKVQCPSSSHVLAKNLDCPQSDGSCHYQVPTPTHLYNYKATSSNAYKDLERIDEGEEEDQDYYCSSDQMRAIYEEKLSPIIRAGTLASAKSPHRFNWTGKYDQSIDPSPRTGPSIRRKNVSDSRSFEQDPESHFIAEVKLESPKPNYDKFNPENVNSAKRSNRPLTMYLPKPDEDIDLVEHIQILGHDIDIISSELTLKPSSASGYLYKSCSSNPKKWLKRFFHFDRNLKLLSYYETEDQLVKKSCPPRNSIPFGEIGDVYVDHSLSRISEDKSSKKCSYVFVLATIKRKFILSTPKAETMRAWIDILFTAAKANDYFQFLDEGGTYNDGSDDRYTLVV